ncbi:unnamed protein product [Amoebophrya sp. A120]|nr:unnamed protein product [Amoebophrya sp. A120]|eukprot:GSA120T00015522001.1
MPENCRQVAPTAAAAKVFWRRARVLFIFHSPARASNKCRAPSVLLRVLAKRIEARRPVASLGVDGWKPDNLGPLRLCGRPRRPISPSGTRQPRTSMRLVVGPSSNRAKEPAVVADLPARPRCPPPLVATCPPGRRRPPRWPTTCGARVLGSCARTARARPTAYPCRFVGGWEAADQVGAPCTSGQRPPPGVGTWPKHIARGISVARSACIRAPHTRATAPRGGPTYPAQPSNWPPTDREQPAGPLHVAARLAAARPISPSGTRQPRTSIFDLS